MKRRAAAALLLAATAAAAEPPEHPALQCHLEQQRSADGAWRLQVRLVNAGSEPVELRPGARLVLYRDAAATDSYTDTARADRLQRSALVLAPAAARSEVLLVDAAQGAALACAARAPAAAALYFYRFEPRPAFRCRLQGWSPQGQPACAAGAAPVR